MSNYDWQYYSVSVDLGPDPKRPLTTRRQVRRWLYVRTGWSGWFRPCDWMTLRQRLMSSARHMHHRMATVVGTDAFS